MVFVQPHKKAQKPGIGLYTYEREKNSTPFAYFAQIVVGAVVASLGMGVWGTLRVNRQPGVLGVW